MRTLKLKNEVRLVVVLTVCLAILLVAGLSIGLQQPIYVAKSFLTTSYSPSSANLYWNAARFNNSQGVEMAFFNFAFRSTNQSQGPVLTTIQFGPESTQSIYLDSVILTFDSGSSSLSWPDIGLRVPTNGFTPTQISRVNVQKVIISYQKLGLQGQGTETFDIWFGIASVSSYTSPSVFLTVDVTAHNPHSVLIGQSYSGAAQFRITPQPSGLLSVSTPIS